MKILFLTMTQVNSLTGRGIYIDLLKHFRDEGHEVFVVSPNEERLRKGSSLISIDGITILKVRTLKLQKSHFLEKGVGQLSLDHLYLRKIKKHFSEVRFDLVLYSTPPITFSKVIQFVKNRDDAYSYLLLKDIFPQNAVDMKMMKKDGFLHRYFRKKESSLYDLSDTIGCMSEANKSYIQAHNPSLNPNKIEVNPNSLFPIETGVNNKDRNRIRLRYDLPLDKKIFVYGGNLGLPQGIDFLLETIKNSKCSEAFFLIVGSGTEYRKIKNWFKRNSPSNALLLGSLRKEEYDILLAACDVGLIFLHPDFTIPNFPSRLLSYLEMRMPVLAATDQCTDVGKVIKNARCGYWVKSGDISAIDSAITEICSLSSSDLLDLGNNGYKLMSREFSISKSYALIINKLRKPSTHSTYPIGVPVVRPVKEKIEEPLG